MVSFPNKEVWVLSSWATDLFTPIQSRKTANFSASATFSSRAKSLVVTLQRRMWWLVADSGREDWVCSEGWKVVDCYYQNFSCNWSVETPSEWTHYRKAASKKSGPNTGGEKSIATLLILFKTQFQTNFRTCRLRIGENKVLILWKEHT